MEQRGDIVKFLRDIVAIPSMDGQLKEVGERIGAEMKRLKFDEVRFDKMGNILGRIGNGKRVLVYDSHVDTVGIGDRGMWKWDPFKGKIEDGKLYARGTCDEKGSTPGMIYGLALARDLGLLDGFTAYYFGNMEEWCWDWLDDDWYGKAGAVVDDTRGPASAPDPEDPYRVRRGGAFMFDSVSATCAFRDGGDPDMGGQWFTGFRCVRKP